MTRLRRLIALLLLLVTAASSAEAVTGELRDGEIHHESMQAAVIHGAQSGAHHGHEGAGSPSHSHDGEHRHGTAADHCTHEHGTPLPSGFSFNVVESLTYAPTIERALHFDSPRHTLLRPPRA